MQQEYDNYLKANTELDMRFINSDNIGIIEAIKKHQDIINELKELQDEKMKPYVEAKNKAEIELIEAMKANNVDSFGSLELAKKVSKEVNVNKVLNVLGGDMDNFILFCSITQKKLNDLSKDVSFENYKKALKGCIEVTDEKITGLKQIANK